MVVLKHIICNTETARHYRLWKQGFKEEAEWKHSNRNHFFSPQARDPMSKVKSLSHGFLRRFHSPTIFLKVVCDGDLLLPINVGMLAPGRLEFHNFFNHLIFFV